LLQEEKARQERACLLQWQGWRSGVLLQGRFVPDAEQEDQQLKRQLAFASQWEVASAALVQAAPAKTFGVFKRGCYENLERFENQAGRFPGCVVFRKRIGSLCAASRTGHVEYAGNEQGQAET
jgi:hypothetical protein